MKDILVQLKSENRIFPVTKSSALIKDGLNNSVKELYIGKLTVGGVNTTYSKVDTTKTYEVVMKDNVVLPYIGVTLVFHLPTDIKCCIYTGDNFFNMNASNSDTNKTKYGWFKDGDTWTASINIEANNAYNSWQTGIKGDMQYRVVFAKFSGSTELTTALTAKEIQDLVDSKEIRITYRNYDDSIISRNYNQENNIRKALVRCNVTTQPYTTRLPAVAHVSDLHGDYYRWRNVLEYCNYLHIKEIVVTGDILPQNTNDGVSWFIDTAKKYGVTPIVVGGNHDHDGDKSWWGTNVILPLYGDVVAGAAAGEYSYHYYSSSTKTWFVCLDTYREGTGKPSLSIYDINLLTFVLSEAKADENIFIVQHSSEYPIEKVANYDKFYSKMYVNDVMTQFSSYNNYTHKLRDIVDAFNKRSIINFEEEAIGSLDFSGSHGTFIGYLTGHTHRNAIGTVQGATTTQWDFKVTTDNIIPCNQRDSINGEGLGICQDVFNIYGIDNLNKVVKIARVGSTATTYGDIQDYMEIPFNLSK